MVFEGKHQGKRSTVRPYVRAAVGDIGTVVGIDTMAEGIEGAMPWKFAQQLIAKGATFMRVEEKLIVAQGPTQKTMGRIRAQLVITDESNGNEVTKWVDFVTGDLNLEMPIISWETRGDMRLIIGETTITNAFLKDNWSVPLVQENDEEVERESALRAMLNTGDSRRFNAIAQIREKDKLESDRLFRLSPTISSRQ